MRTLLVVGCLSSIAACNWGTRPADFQPAVSPFGASVAVRVSGEKQDRVGELLAADTVGVLVRTSAIVRVPWSRIQAMDVAQVGAEFDITPGELVSADKRNRLRLVSRFPQGLSGALLSRVLRAGSQDSVVTLGDLQPHPMDGGGQHDLMEHDARLDSLNAMAARSSARFADRRIAVAEGYRRLGVDFPSMGEHWINSGVLLAGVVDPAHPTLLSYVTVDGRPRLAGVGFVVITRGDSAPSMVPGWPAAWHEHSGLLSDESGAHAGAHSPDGAATHVWVLHSWTALANPDGANAADNWAIPFARAGVSGIESVDVDAAQSLALAFGGEQHLAAALTDAGLRNTVTTTRVDSLISVARMRAAPIATAMMRTHVVTDDEIGDLRQTWMSLSASLHAVLGPGAVAFVAPPHPSHHP